MILKILKLDLPKGSCNFENFQNYSYPLITNCTRGHAISFTNIGILMLMIATIIVQKVCQNGSNSVPGVLNIHSFPVEDAPPFPGSHSDLFIFI